MLNVFVGFKGRQPLMTLNLILKSIFKVILRLTSILSMETRIFDPGFGKSTGDNDVVPG